MIKTAQDAYLAGRLAAMEKISSYSNLRIPFGFSDMAGTQALLKELEKQKEVAALVGLTSQGLLRDKSKSMYIPEFGEHNLGAKNVYEPGENLDALMTHENAARLAMLAGTLGGTYLGGQGARSAALSAGGSMLGAMAGGNLGRAAVEAANAYIGDSSEQKNNKLTDATKGKFVTYGGALGGLGGGLSAGKYLS